MGTEIDFTSCSFDEFVHFVFDRSEAVPQDDPWREAQFGEAFDPALLYRHLLRLFRAPEFLAGRYPEARLEAGFWFLMGPMGLLYILLDPARPSGLPGPMQTELVRAMVDLFASFFAANPLGTTCFMWWDCLVGDLCEGDSTSILHGAIFQALCRILQLKSPICQVSALHGLGHLEHPGKGRVIREYLIRNPRLDAETRRYARDAAAGKVL